MKFDKALHIKMIQKILLSFIVFTMLITMIHSQAIYAAENVKCSDGGKIGITLRDGTGNVIINDDTVKDSISSIICDRDKLIVTHEIIIEELLYLDPSEQLLATSTTGSVSSQGWDQTGAIRFSLTLSYTDTTRNGVTYRQMTSVSGGYAVWDEQMQVSSQSYTLGQLGGIYGGMGQERTQTYLLSSTLGSWSRSISSSTFPAIRYVGEGYMSARYNFTINRIPTGSSWNGNITVNVGAW